MAYITVNSNGQQLVDAVNEKLDSVGLSNTIGASTGASLVGFKQNGTGSITTTIQSKLLETKSLYDYGGVPDYLGTPLYDGVDSGRITATDNTIAFQNLINAAISTGNDTVRIPAGHWGIKTGNLSFSNFDRLSIVGDGIGITIIDFIKEDASNTGGVVVGTSQANSIASFSAGNELVFRDITIKATTKGGLVNGAPGSNRVYEGAIWGIKISGVDVVRFTRVRVERFNYRGMSVIGSGYTSGKVAILDCEGFYNVGSGFWCENYGTVLVTGGEFAYNGVFGEPGTGYGVTASANIGKFIVNGVYGHHNYRKAIDSHGCVEFILKNNTFQNNILYHFANVTTAAPLVTNRSVVISRNTMSNGSMSEDKTWMKSCYDQLATNGYTSTATVSGSCFLIQDYNSASDNIRSISIDGNVVISHYNGVGDTALTNNQYFVDVLSRTAKISFFENNFDFQNANMANTGNVNNHIAMRLYGDTTIVDNNSISFPQATSYTNTTSGLADRGTLFEFKPNDLRLYISGNRFSLNDSYFMTTTGAGLRNAISWTIAGSCRVFTDNMWLYTNDPFIGFNGVNDPYFMGTSTSSQVTLQQTGNLFFRGYIKYTLPDGGLNGTSSQLSYRLPSVNKSAGADVFYVVLDKQYGTCIRIKTNDGSPDLVIQVPFSSYTGITGTTGNTYFSYSGVDSSFVENGLTKLKIIIKAKIALSGDYFGRIEVDGVYPSLGAEKVIQL